VIAGTFVAAALSLILLALGTGMGLSSVSPWSNVGASASTVGKAAIIWLIVLQVTASTMGAIWQADCARKWVNIHADEVHFRDTAHGLLVWAVGLVITTAFLTSAATSMVGGAATAGTATGIQAEGRSFDPNEYFVDTLFRSDRPSPDRNDASVRAEVLLIFADALRQGDVPAGDKTYLANLVTSKTGLSQTNAEKRVSEVFAEARRAADTARKSGGPLIILDIPRTLDWCVLRELRRDRRRQATGSCKACLGLISASDPKCDFN
jgi:hypothetical protein